MTARHSYKVCSTRRGRRSKVEIDEIKGAVVAVLKADHPMTVRQGAIPGDNHSIAD
jgi:hypothetical protein